MSHPARTRRLTAKLLTLGLCTALASGQAQQVKLSILSWYNADQAKVFDQALRDYEKLNPNVKITHTTVSGTGAATYPNVLRTSIAGGRAPDIFTMWAGTLAGPFIQAGFATDLGGYYTKYKWNSMLNASAIKTISSDGKQYGVPIDLRAISMYYRKDLLAKVGVGVPKTFAQLQTACEKLAAQNITCVAAAGTYGWHIMRVFDYFLEHTAGPDLHDQLLAKKTSWDRPEVVKAFELLKTFADKKWLPDGFMGISPDQASQLFRQGKAAFTLEGDWMVPVFQTAKLTDKEFGFAPPPSDQKPLRMEGFAEQLMISQQSKNKDAAAAFLNWWLKPANQIKYYAVNGSSATKGGLPSKQANPQTYAYAQMVGAADTYPILDQSFPAEFMDSTFYRLQSGVVAGQVTPADAAKQMQAGIAALK